jgi:hypothetical protein
MFPSASQGTTSVKSVREKKHSAVMGTQIAQATQIFMLLAAQLGVSALQ